jgi:hypothetical protein
MARAAAVVHQPDDRTDAELAQPSEPIVGPPPVDAIDAMRCQTLPQHRIAQRADAERGEQLQVLEPAVVARPHQLIEPAATDAVDRTLDAAPHLEWHPLAHPVSHAIASSRLGTPRIFE